MKVTETELDLIETYLDGELPMSEAEGLWRRLALEPELTAALDELRTDRALRINVWEQCEPAEAAAITVSRQINSAIGRRRVWESARRGAFYVTAAAACMLIGINIGRQQGLITPAAPNGISQNVAQNVAMNSNVGNANTSAVPVNILDGSGRIVAMPSFQTMQEANNFARQFNNPNSSPVRTVSSGDAGQNVVPVSDVTQF